MGEITGTVLVDKYRIDGLLGQGGMGSVYLGEHVRTGRKVAVKLLDERFLTNPNVVQRFGREARAASAIRHPGIVEVLDLDQTTTGVPFLVMELLPGYTLSTRIETKDRLSLDETMMVMGQLLEALDAAHEHGVVHRDLKPDNIILIPRKRRDQLVKILDFGISQKADERISNLTVAGTVLGTPHYMAPEQALGDSAVDRRADLYSAAIVMYECLTGDVPFDAANYNALIQVILNAAPDSPRDRGADVGPELEKAILVCLDKKKDRRPSTAREMLAFLRAARNRDELAGATSRVVPAPAKVARANPALAMTESGGEMSAVTPTPAPAAAVDAVPAAVAAAPPLARPSLADGDLVIAPKARAQSSKKPSNPPVPKKDVDEDYDPFMETGEGAGKLQLDESVLAEPRTSIRPSLSPSSPGLPSPVPSSPGMPSPSPLPPRSPVPTPRHGRGQAPQVNTSRRPAATLEKKSNPILYLIGALVLIGGGILAARFAMAGDPGDIPVVERPDVPEIQRPADPRPEIPSHGRVTVDLWGTPPGASVRLDGLPAGSFPIQVRRGSSHTIKISAIGYAEREIEFTATEDTRIRGNLRPATGAVP
ncbi:MAG: hypothetical protein DRJ42_30245 [Deltaproteobacteria bacterium]|nr:MAG: hypothetical protein DRJ42_30245 [Deltaproteobacteria bacterium]